MVGSGKKVFIAGLAPPASLNSKPLRDLLSSDDELGFDPFVESTRELAALVEAEKQAKKAEPTPLQSLCVTLLKP